MNNPQKLEESKIKMQCNNEHQIISESKGRLNEIKSENVKFSEQKMELKSFDFQKINLQDYFQLRKKIEIAQAGLHYVLQNNLSENIELIESKIKYFQACLTTIQSGNYVNCSKLCDGLIPFDILGVTESQQKNSLYK